uniref:Ig-like domain-containing protein n=1 Tax=Anopheles epiroticus TaxID=199890 RepID=A0A182PLX5_9DIPT
MDESNVPWGGDSTTVRWKMNGKELLDPVCDWVSEDGTGQLACRTRIIDSGNYSCHLVNPLGKIDVQPVTVAVVEGNPCPKGEFLAGEGSDKACLKCFCSGVSQLCHKAEMYRWNPKHGRYIPNERPIVMDSASDYQRGLGKADYVEECRYPVGFRSTSCERCDFGYNRAFVGPPMDVELIFPFQ